MMRTGPSQDRLLELLAGEAAGDLCVDERRELAQLARGAAPGAPADILPVASLVQLGFLREDARAHRRLPSGLERKLLARAEAWTARPAPGPGGPRADGD